MDPILRPLFTWRSAAGAAWNYISPWPNSTALCTTERKQRKMQNCTNYCRMDIVEGKKKALTLILNTLALVQIISQA